MIKDKLNNNKYSSHAEFAADVRLMCSNSMKYNEGDKFYNIAKIVLDKFNNAYKEAVSTANVDIIPREKEQKKSPPLVVHKAPSPLPPVISIQPPPIIMEDKVSF